MPLKNRRKKCLFSRKRYWYHVSTTLKNKCVKLYPREDGENRSGSEPPGERICVAPTIEQCITAVPYRYSTEFSIYRTKKKVMALPPNEVFDMDITDEGWLETPTTFVKLGTLNFEDIEIGLNEDSVIGEAASDGTVDYSKKVLKWWKRARIKRFIKYA